MDSAQLVRRWYNISKSFVTISFPHLLKITIWNFWNVQEEDISQFKPSDPNLDRKERSITFHHKTVSEKQTKTRSQAYIWFCGRCIPVLSEQSAPGSESERRMPKSPHGIWNDDKLLVLFSIYNLWALDGGEWATLKWPVNKPVKPISLHVARTDVQTVMVSVYANKQVSQSVICLKTEECCFLGINPRGKRSRGPKLEPWATPCMQVAS